MNKKEQFEEWISIGIEAGFCMEPTCMIHEGKYLTQEDEAIFDEGGDPCIPILRLFPPE
jgi:hypothetical protein